MYTWYTLFIPSCLLLTLDVIFCALELSMTLLYFLMSLTWVMSLQRESCLYRRRPRFFAFFDSRSLCFVNVFILLNDICMSLIFKDKRRLWIFAFFQSCLSHESRLYTRRLKSLPAWHSCFISILVWYLYLSSGFLLCTSSCFATSGLFVYFVSLLCIFIVPYDTYICFSYAIFVRHLVW